MKGYMSEAECERMMREHLATSEPVKRTRFVPRGLELRMGYERAARWLDDKEAEEAERKSTEGDSSVFGRILGL